MRIQVPPSLKKFVGPEAPEDLRLRAARGLVPLKSGEMVVLCAALAGDQKPEIGAAARKTLEKMPGKLLLPVLGKSQDAGLLDFFAHLTFPSPVLESVALNPAAATDTLLRLARTAQRQTVEIIARNETRLIKEPEISAAILENPGIGADLEARVREFRRHFLGVAEESAAKPAPAAPEEEMVTFDAEDLGLSEVLEEEVSAEAAAADEEFEDEDFPDDFPEEFLTESAGELDEDRITNMIRYIRDLNMAGRIKLALLGNKEARSILIKEPNRLVCTAVMRNPRLSDPEVDSISKSKSLDESVYREIARNKTWMKRYDIKRNLAFNGKVPVDISMALVKFLNPKDMKDLAKSRDVPSNVSGSAKRTIQAKEDEIMRKKMKKK